MESPVALILLAVTIGISLAAFRRPDVMERFLLRPEQVYYDHQWLRLLTSGFIHADVAHLGMNMLTFFFFAFPLEQYLGGGGLLILYLVSIIVANIMTTFEHKDDPGYASLGASGGGSAVLFSFIVFDPTSKLYMLFIPIPIPAVVFAVGYLIYSYIAAQRGIGNINHKAHLWGAVVGILLTVLLSDEIRAVVFGALKGS
jgi:membrane associated rhomboid family serine protease